MKRNTIETTRNGRWVLILVCGLCTLFVACGAPARVRLAVVLPLSGPHASCGVAIRDGVLVAQIQRGVTPELEVELLIEDSGGDPRRGAELLSSLYDGGALAGLGGVGAEETLALVAVAEKRRRVLLSPSPASLAVKSDGLRQWFRLAHPAVQEGSALARFVSETLGMRELVVAAAPSPSTTALRDIVERSLVASGVQISEGPTLAATGAGDLAALVETVHRSGAGAVLLMADAAAVEGAVASLAAAGFGGSILTTSAFALGVVEEKEDAARAEGVFLPLPAFDTATNDESLLPFVTAFRERYAKLPDLCAANGYDALTLMIEALRRGGISPSGVWKGLRAIRGFPGTRRSMQFDERGEMLDFPHMHRVEGGRFVDYEGRIEARREEIERQIRRLQERRLRLLQELGGG